jgi:hypothetical protein
MGYLICIFAQVPGFTFWHSFGSAPGQIELITVGVVTLLALPLIWFPEQIGSATGYWGESCFSLTQVDVPSPAILVSIFGWVFLLGPLALWYWYR